jgi:ribonuclease BN (tRNA processing enzyme)
MPERAPLRLTVIGSAPAYTRRTGNPSSCYLVEHGGDAIVLDMGHGAFPALAAVREPSTVRGVLVSHLHPDHGVDLVSLRHYLRFERVPDRPVELHGPAELRARYDALTGEEGFFADMPGDPLAPGVRTVGPFEIRVRRVTHAVDSFGFRIAPAGAAPGSPGLAYSGDCGEPADLSALVEPGDTLLCEASFGTGPGVDGVAHLTAIQAATAAREGGAARLILTHILDAYDPEGSVAAASAVVEGTVVRALPGQRFDIA